MALIRPGRTGFRGRRAAEADASFFEDRTGAPARPAPSISATEEAESRARWTHALMRQRLRDAVTRTEKIAGGIYTAALMVLLGHEWPHHQDAAPGPHPTTAEGHDGPEAPAMPAATGHADAAPPAGGEEPVQDIADAGGLDLRKFAPGTAFVPSTLFRAAGDRDAGLPGDAAGGGAPQLGQLGEAIAAHKAESVAAVNEAGFPIGHSLGDIASVGGEVPVVGQALAQMAGLTGTAQTEAKAADATPIDSPRQDPARAQDAATTAETAQSQGQHQGGDASGMRDTASVSGTVPGHGQDTVLAQAKDIAATVATAWLHDQDQSPAKAQDRATAGTPKGQDDSTDTTGSAQDHGQDQGHAKAWDTASAADAAGPVQDHGQDQIQAKVSDIASAVTDLVTDLVQGHGKGQGDGADAAGSAQDHGHGKAQDVASATDPTQGHGKGQDDDAGMAGPIQDQGYAKAQDIASAADPAQGHGKAQGDDAAGLPDDVTSITAGLTQDSGHGEAQDHGQGQGHAKQQDLAAGTDTGQGQDHGHAQDPVLTVAAHDQGPKKAQDATTAEATQDHGHAQGHGAAGTGLDHAQAHDQAPDAGDVVLAQGSDHGHGHDEAFLFPQSGHTDVADALSTLLASAAGEASVHLPVGLPEDASVHGHLHASAAHDLSLL